MPPNENGKAYRVNIIRAVMVTLQNEEELGQDNEDTKTMIDMEVARDKWRKGC